jgi:Raf kinase inhibitor-like YbhB/YbcL family protein
VRFISAGGPGATLSGMRRVVALVVPLVLAVAGCGGGDEEAEPTEPSEATSTTSFTFTGGDVAEGEPIDPRFSCDGENVSPALAWEDPPAGTVELALVVDDPDAPGGSFVHWVVAGLPPDETSLESGSQEGEQGANDAGGTGWTGPCPPGGETHGYVFTLYALDAESAFEAGASADDLREAIDGHVIGEARLTAPYSRSSG